MPTLPALFRLPFAVAFASLLPSIAHANAPVSVDAKPGTVFQDCKDCPQMVVLPTGSFVMGSPDDEVGREPDEGPMHTVTFSKPVAISRFQVTAGEFDA